MILQYFRKTVSTFQVSEEKIHMLEHSAAAMADELLRKSALIQFYCMDGRKAGKRVLGTRTCIVSINAVALLKRDRL